MKILSSSSDGGNDSGVKGFWLIEAKSLFSIVLLKFNKGSRENFHNHAFNAVTWFLKGNVVEEHVDGRKLKFKPSIVPKFTPRTCFHKILANETTYAISFRGPWSNSWKEYNTKTDTVINMTHGRKVI